MKCLASLVHLEVAFESFFLSSAWIFMAWHWHSLPCRSLGLSKALGEVETVRAVELAVLVTQECLVDVMESVTFTSLFMWATVWTMSKLSKPPSLPFK